jgi:hypothetical protein
MTRHGLGRIPSPQLTAEKNCRKCERLLPLTEFSYDGRASDGRQSRCRGCVREDKRAAYASGGDNERAAARAWRLANPARKRELGREWQRKKRVPFVEWLGRVNSEQSCSCGEPVAHWHHVDPATKLFNISHGDERSGLDVFLEIGKCIPVCQACHLSAHPRSRDAAGRFV